MEEFNAKASKDFLILREDLIPLMKSLGSKVNYRAMGMSYDEAVSSFEDKLIHVFFKYYNKVDGNQLKYLAICSLKNLKSLIKLLVMK
jgi:hypothetical protein